MKRFHGKNITVSFQNSLSWAKKCGSYAPWSNSHLRSLQLTFNQLKLVFLEILDFRCPYVKKFLPEWKQATETLEKQGKYILARSDCDGTGKTLCDRDDIQVKKVPTVLLFRNGKRVPGKYCGTKDAGKT